MKKLLAICAISITLLAVAACGISEKNHQRNEHRSKKTVTVTTSFLYDMVEHLAGENVRLKLIIPAGEDPHLYVAKSEDLRKIQSADLVLYHGLHFEGKMQDALKGKGYAVSKTFNLEKIGSMEEGGKRVQDPHF